MYGEDLDLSLRLRLAGWGVGMVPAARVEHDYEFAKGDYKWFYLERNRWWTRARRPTPRRCWRCSPRRCWPSSSRCSPSPAAAAGCAPKLRAQLAVLRTLPMALRGGARSRPRRRAGAGGFAAGLSASLDSPYLGPAAAVPGVRALQAGYWRAVRGAIGG